MTEEKELAQVVFNFIERQIICVADDGEKRTVSFRWDSEGAEGFREEVCRIQEILPAEMLTYQL